MAALPQIPQLHEVDSDSLRFGWVSPNSWFSQFESIWKHWACTYFSGIQHQMWGVCFVHIETCILSFSLNLFIFACSLFHVLFCNRRAYNFSITFLPLFLHVVLKTHITLIVTFLLLLTNWQSLWLNIVCQVRGIKSLKHIQSFVAASKLDIHKKISVLHFFCVARETICITYRWTQITDLKIYIYFPQFFFLMCSVQPFVGVNNYTSSSHTFKKSHTCNHSVHLNIRKAMLTCSMDLLYNNSSKQEVNTE